MAMMAALVDYPHFLLAAMVVEDQGKILGMAVYFPGRILLLLLAVAVVVE